MASIVTTPGKRKPAPTLAVTACSCAALFAALSAGGTSVNAATVSQVGTDGAAQSSFTSGTNWSDGNPPSAANDYINRGAAGLNFNIRAPAATLAPTFAGNSLTLGTTGTNFGQLVLSTTNSVVTINNLTLSGGRVTSTAAGLVTLGGSITASSASSLIADGSVAAGDILAVEAAISGAGGLSFGAGTGGIVRLGSASNSYGGTTSVGANATVQQSVANAFTSGNGNTNVQGLLQLNGFDGRVAGLTVATASGTVENGGTANATLTLGANGIGAKTTGNLIRDNGGTGGTLALVKTGDNRQTFTRANTYTGGTEINDGALQLAAAGSAGTGGIAITGDGSGTLELSGGAAVGNAVAMSGRAGTTAHIDNVSGANSVSGAITLTESTGAADPDSYNIVSSSGTLTLSGPIGSALASGSRTLNLGGGGDGRIEGGVSMAAGADNSLAKTGSGTWTLASDVTGLDSAEVSAGTLALSDETFEVDGDLTIGSGATVAQSGGGDRLSGVAGDTVADGTLSLNGFSAGVNGLAGSGTGVVENGGGGTATLTVGTSGPADKTFGGVLQDGVSGALALVKSDTNRQILTGSNTYSGGTTIVEGQLQAKDGGTLGTGPITVAGDNSGTLELSDSSLGDVTLEGRGSSTAHIDNVAGSNSVGDLALADSSGSVDPDEYNLTSSSGNLSVGGITAAGTSDDRNLNLGGGADGEVAGNIDLAATGSESADINKRGTGTWTLSGTTAGITDVGVEEGTLVFNNAGISYSGAATIADGGTLLQGVAGALDGKIVEVNGALDLNGLAASLPGLNGAATGSVLSTGGSPDLTVTGTGSFAGTLDGDLNLTVAAGANQTLSGASVGYTGDTTVGGVLTIENGSALGDAGAGTTVQAGGQLGVSGGISTAETLSLVGASGAPFQVTSDGANTLTGAISLVGGASSADTEYGFQSSGGVLSIEGDILANADQDRVALGFVGDVNVSGAIDLSARTGSSSVTNMGTGKLGLGDVTGAMAVENLGTGTTVIDGALTDVGTLGVVNGTVEIGATANVSGVGTFTVIDGAVLDADAVVGGFTLAAGQTLDGGGTVTGNVDVEGVLTVGFSATIDSLEIQGDLAFGANSVLNVTIDVGGMTSDMLMVSGDFILDPLTTINFDVLNGPLIAQQPFVFAEYGDLFVGTCGVAGVIPDGYMLDCAYGIDDNQIALVLKPTPAPVPAPLVLIGLGALGLAGTRRYRRR